MAHLVISMKKEREMTTAIRKTGTCVVCLLGLSACVVMDAPIGDSFGVAVAGNRETHIIDNGPASSEPPHQTGARAADAIERYESGEESKTLDSSSTGPADMSPLGTK